jgi:hypothetical protein
LEQARAELSLLRGENLLALQSANAAHALSRDKGRLKYEVLALWTRARALHALGKTPEAIAASRAAAGFGRKVGDPALLLRVIGTWLGLEGTDDLLAEARQLAQTIVSRLPNDALRRRFESAEPVRSIVKS